MAIRPNTGSDAAEFPWLNEQGEPSRHYPGSLTAHATPVPMLPAQVDVVEDLQRLLAEHALPERPSVVLVGREQLHGLAVHPELGVRLASLLRDRNQHLVLVGRDRRAGMTIAREALQELLVGPISADLPAGGPLIDLAPWKPQLDAAAARRRTRNQRKRDRRRARR